MQSAGNENFDRAMTRPTDVFEALCIRLHTDAIGNLHEAERHNHTMYFLLLSHAHKAFSNRLNVITCWLVDVVISLLDHY